jgi:hypothetical protein
MTERFSAWSFFPCYHGKNQSKARISTHTTAEKCKKNRQAYTFVSGNPALKKGSFEVIFTSLS